MYYTYVLESEVDGKRYIGYTKNLTRRLQDHARGNVESTRSRRPLKMIYYEACLCEKDARHRETYFKTGFGRRYLGQRLRSYYADRDEK